MIYLATIAAITLICAAIVQLSVSLWFRQIFTSKQPILLAAEHQKDVAIVMCIRGCDPSLRQSLIGILEQDFGHFTLHLVFDHHQDAAWDVVQEIKREHDLNNVIRIHELKSPQATCGLKCSALLHGIEQIEAHVKYLVLMDADVRPHANWLASVIGPLHEDPEIGLVTGNQWFEPGPRANWGSLFRSMWNAGALVPTVVFQNPWAGTLAMRLSDLHAADLTLIWKQSIVDDGPFGKQLSRWGSRFTLHLHSS
jgi:cellulose synthase/poly-beta-1,6-N-acetylglucosamine synthase-like glycosyltransferase